MDRLGEENAAAVAREAAASRLVVVALGPPPLHPAIAGDQGAQGACRDELGKPAARLAEAKLQHDAEPPAVTQRQPHQPIRIPRRQSHGLLDQQMFARGQRPPRQLDMCRRRGQQQQGFDTFIAQHAVDIGRGGKGKRLGEKPAALGRPAAGPDDLGSVPQIDQAFRMRSDRHAEAEDGEAALHLAGRPVILVAAVTGLLCNIAARRRQSFRAWPERIAAQRTQWSRQPSRCCG